MNGELVISCRTAPSTAPLLTLPRFRWAKAFRFDKRRATLARRAVRDDARGVCKLHAVLSCSCGCSILRSCQCKARASHASLTLEACACRHAQELKLCDASLYNAALV